MFAIYLIDEKTLPSSDKQFFVETYKLPLSGMMSYVG